LEEIIDNIRKVKRSDIFEAEREFKVVVSRALADFRRKTNGMIKEIPIQYLDDGSGQFITHIISIVPDYKNTVIDSSPGGYVPARFGSNNKDDYEFDIEDV
jgi:hypothetical protein